MDPKKAMQILKWVIFDETNLEPEENDAIGAALFFIVQQVEPIYDKYHKETSNDNDQTSTQQ